MPQLIESLKSLIFSKDFSCRNKQNPSDFIRTRLFPFHDLIFFQHFGVWKSTKGRTPCPKARASQMFDVLNKITIDAIISPKSHGERELAAFHFLKLLPNDLILLDRGYPAHWIFKLLLSMDVNFCARISYKRWRAAKKFYFSGKKEQIVKIQPTPTSIRKCFEMELDKNTIVLLFKRSAEKVPALVEQLRTIFIKTTEAVRPNRKFTRKHRVKQKDSSLSTKQLVKEAALNLSL